MTVTDQKQAFLACLSDPSRFSLISTLARGPRCVTELAELVGLSQSCTTRHLQALQRAGIVSSERQGKRVVFTVRAQGPNPHPVLNWAFGSVDRGVSQESAEAGRRRAGLVGQVSKPRTSRPGRSQPEPPPPGVSPPDPEAIEVADVLVVSHDSGWEADDTADQTHPGRPLDPAASGLDSEPSGPSASEPQVESTYTPSGRQQLDDFLL